MFKLCRYKEGIHLYPLWYISFFTSWAFTRGHLVSVPAEEGSGPHCRHEVHLFDSSYFYDVKGQDLCIEALEGIWFGDMALIRFCLLALAKLDLKHGLQVRRRVGRRRNEDWLLQVRAPGFKLEKFWEPWVEIGVL